MNSDNNLPETNIHKPTVELINCAYPLGIPNAHYLTLLYILEKEMSIRSLASVIALIRGGHYSIYMNDVVDAKHFIPNDCGYNDWINS